jgi:hypothetical protein
MKRKVLFLVLVVFLILAIFLSGCCLFENLSADVVITKWEQDYSGGKWSDQVKVYYTITNTGNVDIGYYNIWLAAYCEYEGIYEDGGIYEDWNTIGTFVGIGNSEDRTCWITVGENEKVGEKVLRMNVTNLILEPYTGPLQ